jgi:hypothetical protein
MLGMAQSDERPNFSGTWISEASKLVIRQDPTSVEITHQDGSARDEALKFSCNTTGKSCEISEAGRKASVRIWYNGSKLVIFKTDGRKGEEVGKRRLALAPDGNSLVMEVFRIVPPGETQKVVFRRSD